MRTPAWLGVDVGTSSLKVIAVGADGSPLAEQETAWALDRPDSQTAEADPGVWVRAVDDLVVPMSEAYDVRAVGVTGQMHGTILVDESGTAVRPAVLWPDSRAEVMRPRWDALPDEVLGRLGNPWSAGMTGPVLAWLAEHEPDAVARAERVALPKDLVREHLVSGSTSSDPSDASGTLLWDVAHGSWSREATALIPAHLLPKIRPSVEFVGTWRDAEVVVGGGDTPVSLVALEHAVDGWQPGDVVVNLGTGAQVIDPRTGPPTGVRLERRARLRGRARRSLLHGRGPERRLGPVLGAEAARHHLGRAVRDLPGRPRPGPAECCSARSSRPSAVPSRRSARDLDGSRRRWATIRPRPLAARAAAEAQAFLVRRSWELLDVDARRVFVLGGGAREPWVRQLLADVLGRPVNHLPMRSVSAAGAVILAGGPTPRDARPASATAEPKELPELEDAYQRWRSEMYDGGLPGLP